VGRLVWSSREGTLDATAVAHFAAPSFLALRLVDPAGRSAAEIRTDGESIRVSRRDRRVYWEGAGREAVAALAGIEATPAEWVAILRGRLDPPPDWTARREGEGGCFPARTDLSGGGSSLRIEWDSIEPWPEPIAELGPPPTGFERVDAPPLDRRGPDGEGP
jgi:hypothetical protein